MSDKIIDPVEQLKIGLASAGNLKYNLPFEKIVIVGMGGSMMAGQILELVKPEVKLNWDYDLPQNTTSDVLVICISWSGETEETISSYETAIKRKLDTLVVTTGGRLGNLAQKNQTPTILLPKEDIQPRLAMGYMTGALFKVLGLENELNFDLDVSVFENTGKEIAASIGTKIPLIYTTHQWRNLAYFWKILFNENDKIHAFINTFPALAHNELAGFDAKDHDKFYPIILMDDKEDVRQIRNVNAGIAIIEESEYNYSIVNLSGKTLIEKVFNSYCLCLWTSYYLAKKLNVDPETMEVINNFKKLRSR